MFDPTSFRDVIGLWTSPDAMGLEINAGVFRPRKWFTRDRIPSEWWEPILASATAKGAGLTSDMLTRLSGKDRRGEPEPEPASDVVNA